MRSSSPVVASAIVPTPSARLRNGSSMFFAARQITPSMRFVAVPAPFAICGLASMYEPTEIASVRCM